MSGIFFYSISEACLQRTDVSLESITSYIDTEFDNKEVKTEIVENGFNAELEQDICDSKSPEETHVPTDGESCPVGLQKAALLYPLCFSAGKCVHYTWCECLVLLKDIHSVIDENFWEVLIKEVPTQ